MRRYLGLMVFLMSFTLAGCLDYGDGNQSDGGEDAADGGGDEDITCAFGDDFVVQFDKSCSSDNDCVIVYSAADCCGTGLAVGLNASDQQRFVQAWEHCLTELPMCGCPSGPTQVEDGNSTWEHDSILVRCSQNVCSTYLP